MRRRCHGMHAWQLTGRCRLRWRCGPIDLCAQCSKWQHALCHWRHACGSKLCPVRPQRRVGVWNPLSSLNASNYVMAWPCPERPRCRCMPHRLMNHSSLMTPCGWWRMTSKRWTSHSALSTTRGSATPHRTDGDAGTGTAPPGDPSVAPGGPPDLPAPGVLACSLLLALLLAMSERRPHSI